MGKLIDISGQRFGRLTVLNRARCNGDVKFSCVCDCGVEKDVLSDLLRNGKTQSCGCIKQEQRKASTGAKSASWKGGRRIDEKGYVRVRHINHPNASANGYVREHILVMATKLGRPLTNDETVHHKNGIRHDNRIENLELWDHSHPVGQRVSDKISWAKRFIKRHKPRVIVRRKHA